MLEHLILDDAMWSKLDIMEYLVAHPAGTYTINTICLDLALSYTRTANLVTEIADDFRRLFSYQLLDSNRKLNWQPANYHHNDYIQFLLRHSVSYQFVCCTLLTPNVGFDDFCEGLYLSQSTVLRKLQPLRELLSEYGMCCHSSKMSLKGPENLLRAFYTMYLWAGSHGDDLFLSDFDFSEERILTDTLLKTAGTFMHPKELLLRLAVGRLRFEQGHRLAQTGQPPFPQSVLRPALQNYVKRFISDAMQAAQQEDYLIQLLYLTSRYIDAADFRVDELNRYYQSLPDNNFLTTTVEEYCQYFQQFITKALFPENSNFLMKINLFAILLNFEEYQGDSPRIMDLTKHTVVEDQPAFHHLLEQNKVFFSSFHLQKRFFWLKHSLNHFSETVTHAVLPCYKIIAQQRKLRVALITSPDHYIRQTLTELLNQLEFVELVSPEETSKNADFYVTTFASLLPTDLNVPYFVVDLMDHVDYQTKLFSTLWHIYQKNAAPNMTANKLSITGEQLDSTHQRE